MSDDIVRADGEDDPNRCQAVNSQGQCNNKAVPGGENCMAHGGNKQVNKVEADSIRNYRLIKWQAKLSSKVNSPGIKSLRDEIGILRMVLEERLNQCEDASGLMIMSHTISDLVVKIEKLVSSCHKLEGSMGNLLDKQSILQFAAEIITIITEVLGKDSDKVSLIADRIIGLIGKETNDEV